MNADLETLAAFLRGRRSRCEELKVLAGFDGTVDRIFSAVDRRDGPTGAFSAIPTITDFGTRITAAAGKSANIELVPVTEKIGGNGPIMAGAFAAHNVKVSYLGPLGRPEPFFSEFARTAVVYSLGDPAVTHALEFEDGKIMLPVLLAYDSVNAAALLEQVGRDRLLELLREADLVAMLNWTCLPFMDGILDLFLGDLLPAAGGKTDRILFFDLADPAKHSPEAVRGVLQRISGFAKFGRAVLGLNFSEAIQVAAALGIDAPSRDADSLKKSAAAIRAALGLHIVVIHPTEGAACATPGGAFYVAGPVCARPRITTGAGDHFNAGFCLGLLLDAAPEDCLRIGVLTSGLYVRTGRSPTLDELCDFMPRATNQP